MTFQYVMWYIMMPARASWPELAGCTLSPRIVSAGMWISAASSELVSAVVYVLDTATATVNSEYDIDWKYSLGAGNHFLFQLHFQISVMLSILWFSYLSTKLGCHSVQCSAGVVWLFVEAVEERQWESKAPT